MHFPQLPFIALQNYRPDELNTFTIPARDCPHVNLPYPHIRRIPTPLLKGLIFASIMGFSSTFDTFFALWNYMSSLVHYYSCLLPMCSGKVETLTFLSLQKMHSMVASGHPAMCFFNIKSVSSALHLLGHLMAMHL